MEVGGIGLDDARLPTSLTSVSVHPVSKLYTKSLNKLEECEIAAALENFIRFDDVVTALAVETS